MITTFELASLQPIALRLALMKLQLRDLGWLIVMAVLASVWWLDRASLTNRLRATQGPQTVASPLAPTAIQPSPADPSGSPPGTILDNEDFKRISEEWERLWFQDQPSHLTPHRVHGGVI